jgi:hypothetical protein
LLPFHVDREMILGFKLTVGKVILSGRIDGAVDIDIPIFDIYEVC